MALETVARQRQLKRLELALMVAAILVLMAVFLRRAERLEAEMERVNFELTLRDLQTELMLVQSNKMIEGRLGELAALAGRNPVDRLFGAPVGYVGELDGDRPEEVEPGQWYFDRQGGYLVYRVRNGRFFETGLAGPPRVRLRLEAKYEDRDGHPGFDAAADVFYGLALRPAERYRWLGSVKD